MRQAVAMAKLIHTAITSLDGYIADEKGQAFRAGLIDEVRLFVNPVIVGGGTRFLPDGLRLDLRTVDERRFAGGVVHLRYQASA